MVSQIIHEVNDCSKWKNFDADHLVVMFKFLD